MKNSIYPVGLVLATACTDPSQEPLEGETQCFQYIDTSHTLTPDTTYLGDYPHSEAAAIEADIRERLGRVILGKAPIPKCDETEIAAFTVQTRIHGAYCLFFPIDETVRADSWIRLFGPEGNGNCFYNQDPAFFNYPDGATFADTVVASFEEALDCAGLRAQE